jgi:hypothetical protein
MKQVMIYFNFPTGTQSQYDNVWKDLKAAGHEHPKGLLYHVGAEQSNGGWVVVDVWESEDAFKIFSNVLRPILEKNDIPPVPPTIMPVHNIYESVTHSVSI